MSHQPSDIITPKALLLDERLTPLERNAWLTFRALASSDGTVVLSYDALRKYLPSAPGSKQAALETVSRAVLCLRLSTWIALVEYRRNPMTGFSMASRYAVRNQPLTFVDACLEDDDYLPLLERALSHSSATIRQLAQSILDEAMRQPDALERLPAAARERIEQLRGNDDDPDPGGPSGSPPPDGRSPITNRSVEVRQDIPKTAPASTATVRTVEKEVLKEVHTYRPQSEVQVSGSALPIRFQKLPQDQQQILMARLRGLALEQRQAVLAEWDARCASGAVHNAIAYLIKKAVNGMFKLWAARKPAPQQGAATAASGLQVSPPVVSALSDVPAVKPASREVVEQSLAQIRQILQPPAKSVGQIIESMAGSGVLPTRLKGAHVVGMPGSLGAT
ncbi:STY4528 family pathogenicity island replication protein [Alcaligenes faecalis]|uniref:STY4528 family pathogenicity island replication protein n=1 Tax=Alcaligenes faecalis TaxID=511 RepID=UPI000690ED7A|nr:STY4528 family pathogenicity island replication protein [Alcaligenes faecalis]